MFQKIPPKFHDKTVQSNILWLNLKKINEISVLQSADKHGNPSFHFNAPGTRALKQHQLSQNSSPVCSSFVLVIVCDMHLEPEREKRAKIVDSHTAKNIQIQATLTRYF